MKVLITVLLAIAFLQSSLTSVDFVLMVLLLRSYITKEKINLYLAFFMGLLISHLSFSPLGLQSIVYVVMVQLVLLLAGLRWNTHIAVFPVILVLLLIDQGMQSFLTNQSLSLWPSILINVLSLLPIYILIRFWEERFVIRPDIKLKV